MEQHAFEIEAKRMRPALLKMATHYMEDTDEAEDVVQETLIKLWFLRERLSQYRSIDALAMVITRNLCINLKRGKHLTTVSLEEGWMIEGESGPEQKLMDDEKGKELLELIDTLPNLQQAILKMKHIEGFEVEEIARLTGSTVIAVRTNLSRARKKVREQFMRRNKE
ncbi:MAG: RNA polymerase sigma factor [Bacteroides sp.]|nr:RNA polymerase sigma factor [Bacteroides sp.]